VPVPVAHRPDRRDTVAVTGLAVIIAAVYTVFEIQQQRHFFTAGYDLGIFDQAVHGYAHLGQPISLMKGVHNGFGTHFSELGDHFSPVLALLAPFYRLFPHATTLLIAQGVLFAASIPSVWLFTARRLGRTSGYLVAIAYALAWGLQAAMAADFHEIAFAVPLLAFALERLDAGKLRASVIAMVALILVKEDFGLVIAAYGIVVGLRTRQWRLAGALIVGGVLATVIIDDFVITAFGGRSGYYWSYYTQLGANPGAALWHVIRHPWATLKLAVTPHAKVSLIYWLYAPLGFLSLGSPLVLLSMPLLAERLFSNNPNHWTLTHQYSAAFVPILFLAAVDTIGRVRGFVVGPQSSSQRGRRRVARPHRFAQVIAIAFGVGVLAVSVWAVHKFPFDQLTKSAYYKTTSYEQAEQAAVDVVPSGATVEVSNLLAPHLVDRAKVMLLDTTPRGAPWVVFDEGRIEFPFADGAEQTQRVTWLADHGYRQVFSRDGVVVYHQLSAAGGAS
jgi:uncharacterized membrane protein